LFKLFTHQENPPVGEKNIYNIFLKTKLLLSAIKPLEIRWTWNRHCKCHWCIIISIFSKRLKKNPRKFILCAITDKLWTRCVYRKMTLTKFVFYLSRGNGKANPAVKEKVCRWLSARQILLSAHYVYYRKLVFLPP